MEILITGSARTYENIFTFDGIPGHKIVLIYSAKFKNLEAYDREALDIYESGNVIGQAVWRTVYEIKAGPSYPPRTSIRSSLQRAEFKNLSPNSLQRV